MSLFVGRNEAEEKYVTYMFLRYQYISRSEFNIYLPPRYNKSPVEICDDIVNKINIKTSATGLDRVFFHDGIRSPFYFDDGGDGIYILLSKNVEEKVLVSEVKFLLSFLKDKSPFDCDAVREKYHIMAHTSSRTHGDNMARATSFNARILGLYLWDECKVHGGVGKHGTKAKAVQSLQCEVWSKRLTGLGLLEKSDQQYFEYITATNRCIKAGKVKTFKV